MFFLSLLEEDISAYRKVRQRRGASTDGLKGEFFSGDTMPYGSSKAFSAADISNVLSLQTVSKWLDSMQDLLVRGLSDDIKTVIKEMTFHYSNTNGLCGDDDAEDLSSTSGSDIDFEERASLNIRSAKSFIQRDNNTNHLEEIVYRSPIQAFTCEIETFQSWLDKYKYQHVVDDFMIPDDIFMPMVHQAVRRHVEFHLFTPLENYVRTVISDICLEADCELSENLQKIRKKSQSDFGIPKNIQSPSNWRKVTVMLSNIFEKSIPFDRIEALKRAIKAIPVLFDEESAERARISGVESPNFIGADDMLPIFIFLLATSELPFGLCSFSFEIDCLCNEKLKIGETGYIIATFAASVHHLTSTKGTVGI